MRNNKAQFTSHAVVRAIASLASLLICSAVIAQDVQQTSFGKRAPTLEELRQAFEPKPQSGKLMSMGLPKPVKKSIDMELGFALGSAEISPQIKTQLIALGDFLQGAQLGPNEFLIEGHTDATGTVSSNKTLSDKRAKAVKNYLVTSAKVNPQVIQTKGLGSDHLKDAVNPASEKNRRVEFSMIVKE